MDSVYVVVNQVALVYGRPRLDPVTVELYRRATGIEKDEDFKRRLLELLKTSKTFPVPADFSAVATGSAPAHDAEASEVTR